MIYSYVLMVVVSVCAAVSAGAHELPEAKGLSAGEYDDMISHDEWSSMDIQSAANHGVDVSSVVSTNAADCLVDSYSFIIARGYHSYGEVDTSVCTTIHHATSAGFNKKDAYLFPCPTCSKSAATQVQELTNYLNDNCHDHWSKRIWLDIEGTQYWYGNTTKNREFYEHLVNSCKNKSPHCGVYTSSSQWSAIFGSSSYKYGNELPLWYAHYDGKANFDDFSSFGGWSSPRAKQYAGSTSKCSTGVDLNYAPSF
mmetsp:Transcript_20031/g.28771  ORF Transcript_20031/g.28771 Transcript_20031/m.28771 type:complete len:254 (-) Transcript_20031:145-906(-)